MLSDFSLVNLSYWVVSLIFLFLFLSPGYYTRIETGDHAKNVFSHVQKILFFSLSQRKSTSWFGWAFCRQNGNDFFFLLPECKYRRQNSLSFFANVRILSYQGGTGRALLILPWLNAREKQQCASWLDLAFGWRKWSPPENKSAHLSSSYVRAHLRDGLHDFWGRTSFDD